VVKTVQRRRPTELGGARGASEIQMQDAAMHAGHVYKIALGLIICFTPLAGSFVAASARAQQADPASEPYSLSYAAGAHDAQGDFLGGTELMNLAAFEGRLYAGIGYWMDRPGVFGSSDPRSAAQILVLDSKRAQWRQEFVFDQRDDGGGFKYSRLSTMEVLQFHRFDTTGNVIGPLAEVLAVGLDGVQGAVYTQVSPGKWEDTRIPTPTPVRSLVVHYDPVDRTEKVYAGPGGGQDRVLERGIYSGVYDPSAPGKIRWNPTPEDAGVESRVMSMADCGGALFAAAKPSIFRRDDANKSWRTVYSYPIADEFDRSKYASGFRGLTCVDNPARAGGKVLLSGFEGVSGDILSIDPQSGVAAVELHSRQFLTEQWGGGPKRKDIIAGYNDAPVVKRNPEIRLFSVLARSPLDYEQNSAWFLSRTEGNPPRYDLHEVSPLDWPNPRSDAALWSVRAIAVSPFPEDQGQVLYLGGYDGHFQPDHNTAWLYRVGVDTALKRYGSPSHQ
jgi:hypothetical protein